MKKGLKEFILMQYNLDKMKIMLTSNGLSNEKLKKEFVRLLGKPAEEAKVLVVRNTPKTEKTDEYFLDIVKELEKCGIREQNIGFENIRKEIWAGDFEEDYDVFWSSGGNTFTILDRMRKTGFDRYIIEFIEKGRLYVGTSAGSILIGPSIEAAGWGKEGDDNYIGLKNLEGLNIVDFAVYPHYREELGEEVAEFKRKIKEKYLVQELKDGEAIIIKNKKIRKID